MEMETDVEALRLRCEQLGREPHVWLRMRGFVVRNYSADLEESVLHFMTTVFVNDEPIFSQSGVPSDPVSLADVREMWRSLLRRNHNLTLLALPEDAPGADLQPVSGGVVPLAGVNMLRLTHKDDPPRPHPDQFLAGAAARKAVTNCMNVAKMVNCFERFNVANVIDAAGLAVAPTQRGRGLGAALLQARFSMCAALGVRVTKTVFSSVPAQKVARRCGFQVELEVLYSDLKDAQGKPEFPDIPADRCVQLMVRVFE